MPSFATTAVVRDSGDGLHIALNARFVCANCPSDGPYEVLTWRECVSAALTTFPYPAR